MVWKVYMIIKRNQTRQKKIFWKKKIRFLEEKNLRWIYQYNFGCFFYISSFCDYKTFFPTTNFFNIAYTFLDTDCDGTNKTYICFWPLGQNLGRFVPNIDLYDV